MPQLLDVGHDQARCYRAADLVPWKFIRFLGVFVDSNNCDDNADNQPDKTRDYRYQNPADNLEHRNIWTTGRSKIVVQLPHFGQKIDF